MRSDEQLHQIGTVAERVGLSLRTIRHYEEVGLVVPSGRSAGGFRLYTDGDVERLEQVKVMKPLGFSLEETAEILELRAAGAAGTLDTARLDQLSSYADRAEAQLLHLTRQLSRARSFAASVREEVDLIGSGAVAQLPPR
ncbi:MAG: MerR family transcriptional regulator [Microthrixaceae bacterium]|nr:MerR family transcriptional regulator [Microthrixaceae bacterium]MCB1011096.1 MerR family transcriptional regulator [Microthrixaceae bacterium]MCB9386789.1 MerR family transcriptional regulator [Microthrixaceae bacterium]MCO5320550.1 MerR family transcriptional regulator [Microthrixaceae bacterium]